MASINETHDPTSRSWTESATDFPIQNLPWAYSVAAARTKRCASAPPSATRSWIFQRHIAPTHYQA
jgi:hypothetical protein